MARAYSLDLRKRVLAAYDTGEASRAVAQQYQGSRAWVDRLKQRRRETGGDWAAAAPAVQALRPRGSYGAGTRPGDGAARSDISGVEGFEGAILRVMEGDQNRHDLAQTELAGTLAAVLPMGDELLPPARQKGNTEIIDITEYFQ